MNDGSAKPIMNAWSHLRAVLLLPGMVTVVIPATVLYRTGIKWPSPLNFVLPISGCVFVFGGLTLMVWTNRLFATQGKGTLAPWNPTQKLVSHGVYRHVRNPMIVGIFCILLGESAFFGSFPLLAWFGVFVLVNAIYIPLVEEPGLEWRFGEDYWLYKKNVPRWIPRLRPWEKAIEKNADGEQ
jgi:protein-S-isoprenylcysteine O-methyltransferase Ste14